MDTLSQLERVIAERGTTTIIYYGGSVPGTARAIAPISVDGVTLVARDLETDKRKTFMLDKVKIVHGEAITLYRDAKAAQAARDAMTFDQWAAEIMPLFDGAKLHVVRGADFMAVHDFTRHGKPRTVSLAEIYYCPTEMHREWNMETDEEICEERPARMPWRTQGRAYAKLSHAFAAFRAACMEAIAAHR
jgi:hypothetical protein